MLGTSVILSLLLVSWIGAVKSSDPYGVPGGTNYRESPPKRCYFPPDTGSCTNSFSSSSSSYSDEDYGSKVSKRYFYSTLNYNCEAFPYSGCGGNENNFRTYEECMQTCFSSRDISAKLRKARDEKKCFFRNVYYNVGESIRPEDAKLEDPCNFCSCVERGPLEPVEALTTRIRCIQPKCAVGICGPRNFTCCSFASCCNKEVTEECLANDFRCRFDHQEAFEDTNFSSKNYPCFTCFCDRSYPGYLSTKVCKVEGCGIGFNYLDKLFKGCKPIYKVGVCCPVDWKCPESSEDPGNLSAE